MRQPQVSPPRPRWHLRQAASLDFCAVEAKSTLTPWLHCAAVQESLADLEDQHTLAATQVGHLPTSEVRLNFGVPVTAKGRELASGCLLPPLPLSTIKLLGPMHFAQQAQWKRSGSVVSEISDERGTKGDCLAAPGSKQEHSRVQSAFGSASGLSHADQVGDNCSEIQHGAVFEQDHPPNFPHLGEAALGQRSMP